MSKEYEIERCLLHHDPQLDKIEAVLIGGHMKLLLGAALCAFTILMPSARAQHFVDKKEWGLNAARIVELHENNRRDDKFAENFVLYEATLFLAYNDLCEKAPNRLSELKFALIMYLNAKLYHQYVVMDHPADKDSKERQLEIAEGQLKIFGEVLSRYNHRITADDLNDFRLSFAGHPEFRLRGI